MLSLHAEDLKSSYSRYYPVSSHSGAGIGLRYGIASFPLPLININKRFDKSVFFIEGVLGSIIIIGAAGINYQLSQKSSTSLAMVQGGSIGVGFSGYKLGYTFNSNQFNQEGWEISLELYSLTNTYTYDGLNTKHQFIPTISLGYHI